MDCGRDASLGDGCRRFPFTFWKSVVEQVQQCALFGRERTEIPVNQCAPQTIVNTGST
jgi:hypothetical protein